jgi:hypothetical protein
MSLHESLSATDTPRVQAPNCYADEVNTTIPGSFDPNTGKPLVHPMGGSHWYFPPAFALDTYNKYFLMSGSYDRAGTISFRCVADAVDDCGTGGKLCAVQSAPPAVVTLGASPAEADWVVFGDDASHHVFGNVSKQQDQPSTGSASADVAGAAVVAGTAGTDMSLVSVGKQAPTVVPTGGATVFAFTDGNGPTTSVGTDGSVVFAGADAGFVLTAPAPAVGTDATLTMYVGSTLGAVGRYSAVVTGVQGATKVGTARCSLLNSHLEPIIADEDYLY